MAQEPKKLMNPNRAHGNYKNRISMVSKAYKPLPTDNLYVEKVKGRFNPRVRPGGETAETKEQAMKIEEAENEEPKKPSSPWNLFLAEQKSELIAKAGGKTGPNGSSVGWMCEFIAKAGGDFKRNGQKQVAIPLAAQVWNALPDSAKKPFEDKAREMKKKYAEDMRAFLSAGGTKKSRARNSNESDGSKVEKRIRTNRVDVQKAGA